MPMPLIPIIILGGILTGKGVYDNIDASFIKDEAEKKFNERRKRYENYYGYYEGQIKEARKKYEDFCVIRMEAYETLNESAKLLKNAVVKSRTFNDKLSVSITEINNWELKSGDAIKSVANIISSAGVGYGTAAGIYTAVTMFGTASTGTAISTLSGIAAKNATLAWFGGGAISAGGGGIALGTTVLGFTAFVPALFILGLSRKSSAEKFRTEVEAKIAQMDIEEEKMKNELAKVNIILKRVDEIKQSIIKVKEKLDILNLNILLNNKFLMTSDKYQNDIMNIATTAIALSKLLDQKIEGGDING